MWTEPEVAADPRRPRTSCPSRTQGRSWQESIPKSEAAEGREPPDWVTHQKGEMEAEHGFMEKRSWNGEPQAQEAQERTEGRKLAILAPAKPSFRQVENSGLHSPE